MDQPWELEAENWVRWARTPGHDAYWDYAPGFFDELVPAPGRRTLELGCGEGRVVRDLARRGHRAVGLDASPTLLGHAREADPSGRYVLADAARVPFGDGSFDLVVAYNSLMDIEDMESAVREAARVLEAGGRLCVCVTHPIADAGAFAGHEPDAAFVIDGSYLGKRCRGAEGPLRTSMAEAPALPVPAGDEGLNRRGSLGGVCDERVSAAQ